MSGNRSRRKGRRGEYRCVQFFRDLGMEAHRVSELEANPSSPVHWDVEVGREPRWRVQVKEVEKNCPSLRVLMDGVPLGFVHHTRGRTFVIVDADEFAWLCEEVVEARRKHDAET